MSVTIENGRRGQLVIGAAAPVPCGIVQFDGVLRLAFMGNLGQLPGAAPGKTILVDDLPHVIISAGKSNPAEGGVKGMALLTVRAA